VADAPDPACGAEPAAFVAVPLPGPAAEPAHAPVIEATSVPPDADSTPVAPQEPPRSVVTGREDFAASLETFAGPLDLLLYLIKEDEVEITNIPIARVLEQYLKFIDAEQDLDLHMAGEFLVMATTLMEIKSRELLPVQEALEGEELIEDPRSELVRQLLRYRQLKERARFLESRMDRWQQQRSRGLLDEIPEPAPDEAEPLPMPEIDLYELLTLFERLRKSVLAQVPRAVGYEGETLEEKVVRIEKTLQERPFTRFSALIADVRSRADIALTFIALLELVRRRMIRLMQEGAFGNLDVKVQSQEEAEELAHHEALAAENVVDIAFREKAEREAKLAAEAAAMGVSVDKLPWKTRRAVLARPKFEGLVRPEDVEELDAEEAEISRRIDAILAAADAISQRFEDSRIGQVLPQDGGSLSAPEAGTAPGGEPSKDAVRGDTSEGKPAESHEAAEDEEDRPLTEEDLAPRPEQPPESEEQ
jgi:segregation and condensation protein A